MREPEPIPTQVYSPAQFAALERYLQGRPGRASLSVCPPQSSVSIDRR